NMKKEKNMHPAWRTIRYILPYWYLIAASTVAGVLKLTVPLVLPQVVKYFTDVVLVSGSPFSPEEKMAEIYKWLLILLCLYICIYIPAAFIRQAGSTEVSNRVMHTMRCQLFNHLQGMSAQFHHENKSGSLVTRVNSDVEQVHGFIWNVATNIWIDSIVLIIYLVLMLRINVPLTIVAAVTLPLSVIATKKIRARIRKANKKVLREFSDISGYMQERMAGFAVVKLFGMEEQEKDRFHDISESIYRNNRKVNRYFSLGEALTASFSEIICAVVVCFAAGFIVKGDMSIGDMIVFYSYLGYFITPIRRFAELNVTYARSMAGIERVYEILDTEPDIVEKKEAAKLPENAGMDIAFRHVSFQYDKHSYIHNIDDVSFSVQEGEKIALVGSSGCGKTTIVNLLTRFYDADSGTIYIAGKELREYSLDSLYAQMGMVFQETILFSGTIEENLRYGKPDATMEELEAAARAANAYDFIMKTPDGWNTVLGERGIGLSGGQKQRISIARVFLRNPKLLILDEATSALDSESEKLVQEALDQLMENRTTIVIAHRLSTIVNVDKILVMDKGRIVEMGKHEELLKKGGRYTELYRMQFQDVLEAV
ncbi:MAG: ABC transporter ATP-binding protein, partial [Roseburia sp.]|nr:ABC transporter ATP-binding protein [Roseburia sp.]